ncbi:HaaA family cyclophane-containing RiPP peptide [Streptomyces misionensis]|uniref:HaaA family cyclophane-containing RiPP peptide n=1 Tax=Streptomyces misionensis TaxID=67331 RepID=UPI0036A8F705
MSSLMTDTAPDKRPAVPEAGVLDRVAARVRLRLEAEQASANRVGDGTHAASLACPRSV